MHIEFTMQAIKSANIVTRNALENVSDLEPQTVPVANMFVTDPFVSRNVPSLNTMTMESVNLVMITVWGDALDPRILLEKMVVSLVKRQSLPCMTQTSWNSVSSLMNLALMDFITSTFHLKLKEL